MAPGYQGPISDDVNPHKHEALAGSEFTPGMDSENPEDDKRLKREIWENLKAHPSLDVSGIKLYVKNGYVSLNGKVESLDAKGTVEALVSKIDGVIDVVNFLQLKDAFESGSGDGLHDRLV